MIEPQRFGPDPVGDAKRAVEAGEALACAVAGTREKCGIVHVSTNGECQHARDCPWHSDWHACNCGTFDKPAPTPMRRADYLPVPQKFNLAMACNLIGQCFGRNFGVYHVGSSLEKRDYRDVDIRCILDDAAFDRLFPALAPLDSCPHKTPHEAKGYVCSACKPTFKVQVPTPQLDATWSLICASISLWLQKHSDLPVDFQIQRQTQANEEFKGRRNGIGLYYADPKAQDR